VRRPEGFVPSILVADDNTNIQKMVSLAFEDRGITVVAVGNGEAAVRRIPDLNPDLVLADIFMPVRNGYEVCEFVKKDQRFSHVPVILLVGAFDPLDEKEARRVGADGVLKKPFVPPDPLIAMVISALEKNPRVVAEMAKAKAAIEPHAMPDATAASFEVQEVPRPEPKPLPEFPEPTPEEAALVYGFGKGVRAIDDVDPAALAKEPPAPVGQRHEEDDEDYETGATASDWRRNAMDFEVSDEDAKRPAFSTVDELEPAQFFPSETDVRETEQNVEAQLATARDVAPSVTPVVADEVDLRALEPVEAAAPVERAPIGFAREPLIAAPVPIEPRAPEPQAALQPPREPEPAQEEAKPSLASRMRHWMDALVSQPSHEAPAREEPQDSRDWMSEPRATEMAGTEAPVVEPVVAAPEPRHTEALVAAKPAEENFFADESASHESGAIESSHFEAVSAEMDSVDFPAVEEPPIEAAPAFVEMDPVPELERAGVEAIKQACESQASEPAEETVTAPEVWDRVEDTTPSLRDPNLVVSPAVHVTPEPLLVDEKTEKTSGSYGERSEEIPAEHTFEVTASPEPAEDTLAEEPALPEPSFESAAAQSAPQYNDERVPTGPPPNREALAEIPFLNPPRGFDPNPQSAQASPVDATTVDALVEKLLEKLQPRLHELLSQGVLKPLVENLLQQETKKNK
jgi:CheY-like chemotaxis protein